MAINPVRFNPMEFPANPTPVPIDFRPISEIGNIIGVYRQKQEQADILRGATDASGNLDINKATSALAGAGHTELARSMLDAAQRQQALTQSGAAQAETGRHNRATEEALRTGKIPFGWEIGPDGQPFYSKGGPADPEYMAKLAELKQKPRELSITDITKLSEEGGKFSQLAGFSDQFQDKYAGYTVPGAGGAVMTAGRYLSPAIVGKDVAEAARFWQGYDRFKNVTRNELYGAALTKNEQAAFEQADINPGMQPEQIRNNLKVQQDIVKEGLKRKASSAIASNYDPVAIAKAYGLSLEDLGVDASGRRGTVAPAAPATAAPGGGLPPLPPGFIMR